MYQLNVVECKVCKTVHAYTASKQWVRQSRGAEAEAEAGMQDAYGQGMIKSNHQGRQLYVNVYMRVKKIGIYSNLRPQAPGMLQHQNLFRHILACTEHNHFKSLTVS